MVASKCAHERHARYWNNWNPAGISSFFSIMHFHMLRCTSEARFRPPTCEFRFSNVAAKTNAKSITTTRVRPHRHRNHSFYMCFVTFSAFLKINDLDAVQGAPIGAPSLSFTLCAKAYKNHMNILCLPQTVPLRGVHNIKIIEPALELVFF